MIRASSHDSTSSPSLDTQSDGRIISFVESLVRARPENLVNPWSDEHPDLELPGAPAIRAANLVTYLRDRVAQTTLMLIGEAPGYQGCRFSGVAFTSERSLPLASRTSRRPEGWSEPSATIVHRALAKLDLEMSTILWNACPFHPAGTQPLSNRTPTVAELALGTPYLHDLIDLVRAAGRDPLIVAIGRSAARSLPEGTPAIRHPANGGARLFAEGLVEQAARLPR